jgi:hypothetical protein
MVLGNPIRWPQNKRFAFTIVDDTDGAQLDRIRRVYDVLSDAGMRTTKTVWPLRPITRGRLGGDSLECPAYASWIRELKQLGFETAFHGASDGKSHREHVILALDRFRDELGSDPQIHTNHDGQSEALYWGAARVDPPWSWSYALYRAIHLSPVVSLGHVESSNHFWGDLCQERIRFVRNLVFSDINTLKMDPLMPYHDPRRPYVNYWFSSSNGSGVHRFYNLLSEENQDRLLEEGGACIVYSHLAAFEGVPEKFRYLIRRLARMKGWFVPASELLEYVGEQRGWINVADHTWRYMQLQAKWLIRNAAGTHNGANERGGAQ